MSIVLIHVNIVYVSIIIENVNSVLKWFFVLKHEGGSDKWQEGGDARLIRSSPHADKVQTQKSWAFDANTLHALWCLAVWWEKQEQGVCFFALVEKWVSHCVHSLSLNCWTFNLHVVQLDCCMLFLAGRQHNYRYNVKYTHLHYPMQLEYS